MAYAWQKLQDLTTPKSVGASWQAGPISESMMEKWCKHRLAQVGYAGILNIGLTNVSAAEIVNQRVKLERYYRNTLQQAHLVGARRITMTLYGTGTFNYNKA